MHAEFQNALFSAPFKDDRGPGVNQIDRGNWIYVFSGTEKQEREMFR